MATPVRLQSTSSHRIHATRLEPEAFKEFGEVIQNPTTHNGAPAHLQKVEANQGSATKWLDITRMVNWYGLGPSKKPARSVMNMFVCKPRQLQTASADGAKVFPVKILERHPFTPQTFIPLGLAPDDEKTCYLVIVAPTLPLKSQRGSSKAATASQPPYPPPPPRRKRSLRERLLGARPNPFTNDFTTSTTPPAPTDSMAAIPKGPGLPDMENIRAFIARGDQAVTYGPGTWHAPMVVLGERTVDFVVVQYANGVAVEDCQEVVFEGSDTDGGISVAVGGAISAVEEPRAKL